MKDPFELITWAFAIFIAWTILIFTGVDDWLKKLFGRASPEDLAAKVAALERRVAQLEDDRGRREPLEAIRPG
jgi:hypothetical protein